MAETKDDDIVVFNRLNPETGKMEEVSNDPRFKARPFQEQMAAQAAELARIAEEEQQRQVADSEKAQQNPAPQVSGDNYESLDGKALKKVAEQKGVDITGIKKVSALRKALRAADEAARPVVITGAEVANSPLAQPLATPTQVAGEDTDDNDDDED